MIDSTAPLTILPPPGKAALKSVPNLAAIEEAADEFESVFVAEMLKPMFEGIETDPMFGGGRGEDVFRGLMIEEYGKKISESGGLGLASFVRAELIRLQEESART